MKSLTGKEEYSLNLNPGDFKPAPADNSESIDGYFSSHIFQITRNYHHPVNAKGIRKHFELLKLPNPQELTLIFVVPKGLGDYKKQEKEKPKVFCRMSRQLQESDVLELINFVQEISKQF